MPRTPGRPRRTVAPLTHAQILAAALERVAAHGFAGLTMRSLAADLGVDPMALYHYMPNKAALINALVGQIFARFDAGIDPTAPWPEQVHAFAQAYYALTQAHPHVLLALAADPGAAAVAAQRANPALHRALAAAGLTPAQAVPAADLLIDYIHGVAIGVPADPPSIDRGVQIILAGIQALYTAELNL